ncbi:MAG: LecA/PA-IL family lectin [Anaerolineae bacterium]|nr:LecA/PA-IL family lectin [Anaerolineae bacterium]
MDTIIIALIGFVIVIIGVGTLGLSTITAAVVTRSNRSKVFLGLPGVVALLGAALGMVGSGLLCSAVVSASRSPECRGWERSRQEFTVLSNRGWQDSGVMLREGQQFRVEYVSGQWTYWSGTLAPFDGNGDSYTCGRAGCCEPLPGGRKGALIGNIGNEVFLIGNGGIFTARSSGRLLLRMNDCDSSLADNEGTILVRIVP